MEEGVEYLLEASVRMECDIDVRIRALILYHHFMRCIGEVYYDPGMVAACALNLSSKVSEEIIEVDTLVLLFYCIVNKTDEPFDVESEYNVLLKKSFVAVDFIMQRMLEFTLNHRLAHQYLLPFLDLIFARSEKIASFHQSVSRTCLRLLSDFYTSRKCLNYTPEHIAVACIDATIHMYELHNDIGILDPWYEGLCQDFNAEILKEIKHDVFVLYINENTLDVSSQEVELIPSSSNNNKSDTVTDLERTSLNKGEEGTSNEKESSSHTKEISLKPIEGSSKQKEDLSEAEKSSLKPEGTLKSKETSPSHREDSTLNANKAPLNIEESSRTKGESSKSNKDLSTSEVSATKETPKVIEEITID